MDNFARRHACCDLSNSIRHCFHLGNGYVNTRIIEEIVVLAMNNSCESKSFLKSLRTVGGGVYEQSGNLVSYRNALIVILVRHIEIDE